MATRSVGFRLGVEGKSEVKNDFAEVKQAGEAAMTGVAKAAEDAAERADRATEAFTERQIAAYRRQADAAKLAAAGVTARSNVDTALSQPGNGSQFATVNLDRSTGAARQSAGAFDALFEQEDEQARRAAEAERLAKQAEDERAASLAKVRAMLDPLSVAQRRYDDEIATYDRLLKSGDLSEKEHAAVVATSTARLNEAKHALDGHNTALGLNHIQMQVGTHLVRGFGEQWLYTGNAVTAASAQVGHMISLLQNDDGGVSGGLAKVRGLLTPTTVGIAAAAAAVALGVAAWASYAESLAKLGAAAEGTGRVLGLSGDQLEAAAIAAADAGNMTVGAARDIETAFLGVVAPGRDAQHTLEGLTALTRDFAAATGKDAKDAATDLAAIFSDPAQGADELAAKYGVLTQAQAEHIAKLVEEGNQTAAQTALQHDLARAFDGAADHAEKLGGAWSRIKSEASQAAETMGRALSLLISVQYGGAGIFQSAGPARTDPNAASNAARARAEALVRTYQGDGRATLQRTVGTLRAGIAAGGDAGALNSMRDALAANERALSTWIPAQEKATRIAQLDAQIAGTHDRALKQRLGTQRAQVAAAGEVITAADAQARATAAGARAAGAAASPHDAHAKALAREAASMEVNAREALAAGDAYLRGTAAGIEADARRKAATDATRKGIDIEAQTRRQLALQVSETVLAGDKSVAQLRDETAARDAVLARVKAGTLGVDQMGEALSDEAALRPLLTLRTLAQGTELKKLTEAIAAYRATLDSAHEAERNFGLAKSLSDSVDRVEELRAQIVDLAHTPLDAALNAASRAANRDADAARHPVGSAGRINFVRDRVAEAQAQYDRDRAVAADKAHKDALDSIALASREAELVGASDATREHELNLLHLKLDLARSGLTLQSAEGRQRLADLTALDATVAKLNAAKLATAEMQQAGSQFLDDLLNPDGSGLKNLLHDVEMEFIKLAALNPLKNLLFGGSAPTLTGVLGSLLGGKSNFSLSPALLPGHNATGTERWSGGLTWVGENGPELISAPAGSRIASAAASRALAASNDNVPAMHFHTTINAPNSDSAALARLEAKVDQGHRAMSATVAAAVADRRTRTHGRG